MSYLAVKHIHITLVIVSVMLFYVRAFSRLRSGRLASRRWLFISSHGADTLLLLSAVALLVMAGMNPLQQPWLSEKIVLVVAYIGLGIYAARESRRPRQWALLALSTVLLLGIGYLAGTKQAIVL